MKHAALLPRFLLPVVSAFLLSFAVHANEYDDVKALAKQGKASQALAQAEAYIAEKPRDPQMRFLRGVILSDQGRQADATQVFVQLTQDFPELPEPYNNLAALYASQSQFDKARAALETAIRLNPSYATAHENLGDVYVRLASQAYSRAQQLDNSNATIPPKQALIRELFSPKPKAPRSAAPAPAAPQDNTLR